MLVWDDLRFVLALSRHGTATGAGRALDVNATTVARRVQALETRLGARLFDRLASGAVPTEAGARVVETAERIEESLLGLDAQVRGLDAELSGHLRVASLEVLFDQWRDDLAAFRTNYPRVSLSLLSSTLPADLSRREADVAVRISADPPEELVGRRLSEVFYGIYGSPDLVARTRPDFNKPRGESVENFDKENRTFTYAVIEGRPGMVTRMENTWSIDPVDAARTKISLNARIDLKPVAQALMGWMMKRQLDKLFDKVCEDATVFLESEPGAVRAA